MNNQTSATPTIKQPRPLIPHLIDVPSDLVVKDECDQQPLHLNRADVELLGDKGDAHAREGADDLQHNLRADVGQQVLDVALDELVIEDGAPVMQSVVGNRVGVCNTPLSFWDLMWTLLGPFLGLKMDNNNDINTATKINPTPPNQR